MHMIDNVYLSGVNKNSKNTLQKCKIISYEYKGKKNWNYQR